jgi:hypothetical protein
MHVASTALCSADEAQQDKSDSQDYCIEPFGIRFVR